MLAWEDLSDLTWDDWQVLIWYLVGTAVVCGCILLWGRFWPIGGPRE
jgi:hypothetical protein